MAAYTAGDDVFRALADPSRRRGPRRPPSLYQAPDRLLNIRTKWAAYPGGADVSRARADPSRRRLLDSLNRRNGQTLRELCVGLDMARQSVSKHLAVLEAA